MYGYSLRKIKELNYVYCEKRGTRERNFIYSVTANYLVKFNTLLTLNVSCRLAVLCVNVCMYVNVCVHTYTPRCNIGFPLFAFSRGRIQGKLIYPRT